MSLRPRCSWSVIARPVSVCSVALALFLVGCSASGDHGATTTRSRGVADVVTVTTTVTSAASPRGRRGRRTSSSGQGTATAPPAQNTSSARAVRGGTVPTSGSRPAAQRILRAHAARRTKTAEILAKAKSEAQAARRHPRPVPATLGHPLVGTGPASLGTIVVGSGTSLAWQSTSALTITWGPPRRRLLLPGLGGKLPLFAGSYKHVRVNTHGSWRVSLVQ
jgi:hypothetical protein